MDLLTRADLELLAQRGGPEPYLSLVHTDRAAVVRLGDDEAFGHCELLDRGAVDTLSGRGHVYAVPAAEVPGGGDVAAIFRY